MAALSLEKVPEEPYEALRKPALRNRKSIAAAVLTLLEQNIPRDSVRQPPPKTSLAETRDRGLPTVPLGTLVEQALVIVTTFDRTVYDSINVALAMESRGQRVTGMKGWRILWRRTSL